MKKILSILILLLITPSPAFAYLDPGTGSMILSTVIAFVAMGLYTSKNIIFKLRYSVGSSTGEKIKQKNKFSLVFYNEGRQYCSTFLPVLKRLKEMGVEYSYLYSEKDDYVINEIEGIDSHYIGKGNRAFIYLNSLSATMCVMTTPGLDVLQIRRSRGVRHYCHIVHSAAGVTGYKVFGLDYYDSILAQCKYDREFIQILETKRKTPGKDVRIVGIPYLDSQLEKLREIDYNESDNKTVLVSPSWGEHSLLAQHGQEILGNLTKEPNYRVIVRPHPQSVRYEKKVLEKLQSDFQNVDNITWDLSDDNLDSMARSDCMISDFSGIILDYIFLFEKPVISFPSAKNYDGLDYISRDEPFWFIKLYYDITYVLDRGEIADLPRIVKAVMEKHNIEEISEVKRLFCPYFGSSSTQAATEILDIYRRVEMEAV